jgi:hypothetical protein
MYKCVSILSNHSSKVTNHTASKVSAIAAFAELSGN